MRIQKTLLISVFCLALGTCFGCANRNPYAPYPTTYPQQYQAYPYAGQPGLPIQPSPYVGQPVPGTGLPSYAAPPPAGYAAAPPQGYMQPAPTPGYYPPQGQPPLIGR